MQLLLQRNCVAVSGARFCVSRSRCTSGGARSAGASAQATIVLFGFGDPRLAPLPSRCWSGALATSIGLLFPWVLQRLGIDPAFGSGPLATVVQDVLSLLVYLAVCTVLL